MPDPLSLVWGHLVHFAKLPTCTIFLKLCSSNNFHLIHPHFTTVHICRLPLMPDCFSLLVWGHSVHFAKFPILHFFKALLLSQFSFHSSKLYTRYHNHTGCHFSCRSAKNCKNYGTLKFFLKQDYMQLGFQGAITPTIFIGNNLNIFLKTVLLFT